MRLSFLSFKSRHKTTSGDEKVKSSTDRRPWRTGILRRAPIYGLFALLGAILCAFATVAILEISDGLPLDSWQVAGHNVQPAVLLSIFATLANMLLRQALAEGVRIRWWTRAQKGTSIGVLHRTWLHGNAFWPVVFSGRQMGLVGVSSLLVVALMIDGPFLQRASSVASVPRKSEFNMTLPVSPSPFMTGATGQYAMDDPENAPTLKDTGFTKILRDYNNRDPIRIPGTTCHGRCEFDIEAAGFDMRCEKWTTPYQLMSREQYNRWDLNPSEYHGPPASQTMFWTNVTIDANILWPTLHASQSGQHHSGMDPKYDRFQWNTLLFSSMVKSTPGQEGHLDWRYCIMQEAVQRYPVTLVNETISLRPPRPNENLTVYQVVRQPEMQGQGIWPSTFGGLYLAISRIFQGSAQMMQVQEWALVRTNDSSPLTYMESSRWENLQTNKTHWTDPIDDMLTMLQELSLRTAIYNSFYTPGIAASIQRADPSEWRPSLTAMQNNIYVPDLTHVNRTVTQSVRVSRTLDETVYISHRGWMLGAFAAMALAFFGILPLFASWAELGRDVSLNPIETARAFDAPLLRESDPNGTASELMAGKLGNLRVRYGASHSETGDQEPLTYEGTKAMLATGEVHEVGEEGSMRRRLRFGRENTVEKPRDGETFGLVRAESLALYSRSKHGQIVDR